MRLIDADALPRLGQRGGLVHWKDIKDAPTMDAVQGEKMSNQRVIEWVPIRERKPHLPGIYLVTAKTYDGIKEDGRTISTAAHFTPNGFLLEGVIAWAKMPAAWTDEEEQLTLF